MSTIDNSREAIRIRRGSLSRIAVRTGCPMARTALLVNLSLLVSAAATSATWGQELSWQDPPRRHSQVVATNYADDQLPTSTDCAKRRYTARSHQDPAQNGRLAIEPAAQT